jgi:glycerol uptake facilitator-like aquaporin
MTTKTNTTLQRPSKNTDTLKIRSVLLRQFLGEFLGTCVLLVRFWVSLLRGSRNAVSIVLNKEYLQTFNNGAAAQLILSRGELSTFLTINIAAATAVLMGVVVCGGVSGWQMHECNHVLVYRWPPKPGRIVGTVCTS